MFQVVPLLQLGPQRHHPQEDRLQQANTTSGNRPRHFSSVVFKRLYSPSTASIGGSTTPHEGSTNSTTHSSSTGGDSTQRCVHTFLRLRNSKPYCPSPLHQTRPSYRRRSSRPSSRLGHLHIPLMSQHGHYGPDIGISNPSPAISAPRPS